MQLKLVVLKLLAIFLQQALSVAGDDSLNPNSSWYMSSAFASARAHKSFDAYFGLSLASGPSKVVWKPEAAPSEEQFVGTFPLVDLGVDDGFSLQELSSLHSTFSAESRSPSIRLKHISVCFPPYVLPSTYSSVHSVWRILSTLSSSPPFSIALRQHLVSVQRTRRSLS